MADALIDRDLTDDEIRAAFVSIFRIKPHEIEIVPDLVLARDSPERKILCDRTDTKGDFPLYLSVYVQGSDLQWADEFTMMRQFCIFLKCRCLIPDPERPTDPYAKLLLDENGAYRQVHLDASKMDGDPEEYVLES